MSRTITSFWKLIKNQQKRILLFSILVVLLFGIIYSSYLGEELRFLPDERDYLILAQNLAQYQRYAFPVEMSPIWPGTITDNLVPTAFRAPGYPLILSIFAFLGAGATGLRIVNFVFLALSLFCVYRILQEHATGVPIIGVFLVFAYPVLFYTAGTFYPQTLGGLLFLGVIYFAFNRETTFWKMALAGFLWGYLVLTIPLFVFTFPIFLFWMIVPKKIAIKYLLIFVVIALLVVGIWTYRNYQIYDSFVFVSTNLGLNLAVGNSEFTRVNAETDINFLEQWPSMHHLTEIEQNVYLRNEALNFIKNHTTQALKLYMKKLVNYFNYRNQLATGSQMLSGQEILMLITYGTLLFLAITRVFVFKLFPLDGFELLLMFLYIGSAFVSAIFFTRIRLRLPFDYALILFDALFIEKTLIYLKTSRAFSGE